MYTKGPATKGRPRYKIKENKTCFHTEALSNADFICERRNRVPGLWPDDTIGLPAFRMRFLVFDHGQARVLPKYTILVSTVKSGHIEIALPAQHIFSRGSEPERRLVVCDREYLLLLDVPSEYFRIPFIQFEFIYGIEERG